jgi:hypothetical protein
MGGVSKCKSTYSTYNFLLGSAITRHETLVCRKISVKSAPPPTRYRFLGWQLVPILMLIVLALFTIVCFSTVELPWETRTKTAMEQNVNLSTTKAWSEIIKMEKLQMMTTV